MDLTKKIEIALFEAASGFEDETERDRFLDATCQNDSGLRERLDGLLRMQDKADQFFDTPTPVLPPKRARIAIIEGGEDTHPGQVAMQVPKGVNLAHFRLAEKIGEGGCGIVYRAEQLEPVRREVALKIIRLGMDTESVIARFERERRALSMMEHPNIARVLDAGATFTGRPFFVMELVRGENITAFCKAESLDLRKRLELFVRICNAIQHAHQKGVIHRDIKPSNVLVRLVDGEPVPKVIDFGIAKATAGEEDDTATATQHGQILGTPAYMSPEQAEGGADIDTRSDVYSLGALLYELVTCQPPFDPSRLKDAGAQEARRMVLEEVPVAPSVVRKHRGLVELDWIVRKAMAKERNERYDTANGLGSDVQRLLAGEPVQAGPPRRTYRLVKLVRRNKMTFLAGAVAILALVVGFGVSTRLFFLERKAAAEQARLRNIAEVARENETRLRMVAEYQNRVSQAAVLLRYGDRAGADKLLESIPTVATPSSLEAGDVYHQVADWHLNEGRWDEAAQRYAALVRAISNVDESDNDIVSRNLLYAATAVCYTGDGVAYQRIVDFAIERFADTTHPVVAEQVIKVCLLKPAGPELLAKLQPLGKIVRAGLESDQSAVAGNQQLRAWGEFALALLYYRTGEDRASAERAHLCLSSPRSNPAREASARIILAMTELRMGREDTARELVSLVSGPVIENTNHIGTSGGESQGSWYAWVTARILLAEVEEALRE
ncbi:hypothetical protein HNR46_003696 [Haloferula luteola]|uniref:Protein kinase domain-containing protein n=1 Tax=Haloferula luteola TaxID=595692 RepID=A0A840V5Y6_9BACT|nr:serine/threonine-protein kinase [Haloferula luteola]MBB5353435.1 hypothetical protein [Haloferula luteola]